MHRYDVTPTFPPSPFPYLFLSNSLNAFPILPLLHYLSPKKKKISQVEWGICTEGENISISSPPSLRLSRYGPFDLGSLEGRPEANHLPGVSVSESPESHQSVMVMWERCPVREGHGRQLPMDRSIKEGTGSLCHLLAITTFSSFFLCVCFLVSKWPLIFFLLFMAVSSYPIFFFFNIAGLC